MQKFLFDNRVRLLMTNVRMGDFHPLSENFMSRLDPILDRLGTTHCISPATNLTNKIFVDAEDHLEKFTRSPDYADAVITRNSRRALMIATADCFSGVVFDPDKMGLALVHLGLKNIYREDGSPSTLENAVNIIRGRNKKKRLFFWFGGGIGNCCYGIEDQRLLSGLLKRYGKEAVSGIVEKGPLKGLPAVDLHNIIYDEAIKLGLEICNSRDDIVCTSCYVHPNPNGEGFGHFFSHVRDPEAESAILRPRNGVFAMMR